MGNVRVFAGSNTQQLNAFCKKHLTGEGAKEIIMINTTIDDKDAKLQVSTTVEDLITKRVWEDNRVEPAHVVYAYANYVMEGQPHYNKLRIIKDMLFLEAFAEAFNIKVIVLVVDQDVSSIEEFSGDGVASDLFYSIAGYQNVG